MHIFIIVVKEMTLLNDVNQLGSNVDEYVNNLDKILENKINCI